MALCSLKINLISLISQKKSCSGPLLKTWAVLPVRASRVEEHSTQFPLFPQWL